MTVAALDRFVDYLEDGVTVEFAVPFRFNGASGLRVTRVAADGTRTVLTAGLHYSASGGTDDDGGEVTLVSAGASGGVLLIEGATSRAQAADYTTNDRFPADSHEAALDRLAMVDMEQDVALGRTLSVPAGESGQTLPPADDRAGKLLAFDSNGDVDATLSTEAMLALIASGDAGLLEPVEAAIFTNITLSGVQSLPGYEPANGERILVAGQTTGAQKGIYLYNSAGAWTRASDMAAAATFGRRQYVAIRNGDHAGSAALNVTGTVTVGTSDQDWKQVDYRSAGRVWFTDTMSGISVQDYADMHREPLWLYTDETGGSTNTDRINTAILREVPLRIPRGRVALGSNLFPITGTDIKGVGRGQSYLVKTFFQANVGAVSGGDTATFMPEDPGAGTVHRVSIDDLTLTCQDIGGVGVYDGADKSGKHITTGMGEDWYINVDIDFWNGWAVTIGGSGHRCGVIRGLNPKAAGGVDLVHVMASLDPHHPHTFDAVLGIAGDDLFGVFPQISGTGLADQDILGAVCKLVAGRSLMARIIGIGHHDASLTSLISGIHVLNASGKGTKNSNGAVTIVNNESATARLQDISINVAAADATGCKSYCQIFGPQLYDTPGPGQRDIADPAEVATAREQMRDITIRMTSARGTTGPSVAGARGINLSGQIDNLTLDMDLDCSSAEHYIEWLLPGYSRNHDFRLRGKAGSEDVFHMPSGIYFADNGKVDMAIENVATNKTLLNVLGMRKSEIRVSGQPASGATGTKGVYEGSNCTRNRISGDVSAFATPVDLAQADSDYDGLEGYVTQKRQTGLTYTAGLTTMTFAHLLGYSPSPADFNVVPTGNFEGVSISVASADATNVTINLSAALSANRTFSLNYRRTMT